MDQTKDAIVKVRPDGISVIVCCYNSALRIVPTLEHLVAQEVPDNLNWEIILVDNNSTDNTADIAIQYIEGLNNEIEFKVVSESQPGLSYARNKGFSEAKFEIVLMVDDDNSLAPNYVEGISRAFENQPQVGMVGGLGIAALEQDAPNWFAKYDYCFAVGNQQPEGSAEIEHLYGAGLALRLSALDKIKKAGFKSLLSDRTGNNLMSGGDTELCFVFRMAGYQLKYEPKLTFRHHLPQGRINWKYIRRLFSGFGQSKAFMEIYTAAISGKPIPAEGRFPFWLDRAIYLISDLKSDLGILLAGIFSSLEGDDHILTATAKLGQLRRIIALKGDYLAHYQQVYKLKEALESIIQTK